MEVGDIFEGKFRIEQRLGEGGNAVVFEATELQLERRVALKVLKRGRSGEYADWVRARFRRELAAVGQLTDPHTLRLFEYGETSDGVLWATFELLGGHDLSDMLRERGQLSADEAEQVLRGVLYSLREAHRAGIIHRDLKPENIRVSTNRDGSLHARVLDFGIARPLHPTDVSITGTGELLGTPRYMSPEQLTEGELTPASDIYALGLILFEMLLGRAALHGGAWGDQLDRLRSGHLFAARRRAMRRLGCSTSCNKCQHVVPPTDCRLPQPCSPCSTHRNAPPLSGAAW